MKPIRFDPAFDDHQRPVVQPVTFAAPQKTRPINFSLNIDGRTLASALVDHLFEDHPTGPPSYDGSQQYGI
jgi:hypothetical protein